MQIGEEVSLEDAVTEDGGRHMANNNNDYLTGLLGTGEFIRECEKIVEEGGRKLAFITNDISNFKYVNDLYSMEEGDRLITELAHFFYIDNPACLAACRKSTTRK